MSEFRLDRRAVLKTGLASAAFLAAPAIISSKALASSGEVKLISYAMNQQPILDAFEKETGIKVKLSAITNDDEMFSQVKLGAGTAEAADLCEPASTNIPLWYGNGFLQAFDPSKLAVGNITSGMPGTKEGDAGYQEGKLVYSSTLWGGEGMGYASDVQGHTFGEASLADILDPAFVGQVTVRAHSALAAIGRILEAQGKLPKPFLDSYKDEAVMRANYDVIIAEAIKHKPNIAQFWTNDNEGNAAFTANGCRVGLIWESMGRVLADQGVRYIAPKEGVFGWNQGFVLLKGAPNVEAAHAFVKYISQPENSAKWAAANQGLPSVKGAVDLMDDKSKAFTAAAYPGDAISKVWWWPPQDPWFIKLRGEYADKWRAA
ncbi:extracellular solute-binding protein [Mesorhizobium sp. WSM4887]|uniref:extracellular solute-binding protein n=1 Tax=Mesorhizobium sp. WSM4887 TaxID=3038543 RepID=UPI0024163319|nr:extracellular solute-binding protein [Mesorhizobium sp. WSM4887]MDG4886831.1 extracellular solute-binding protein [Mesorhizobium sp. WSM4887]